MVNTSYYHILGFFGLLCKNHLVKHLCNKKLLFYRNLSTIVECCFVDIHLFYHGSSPLIIISAVTMSEIFPACFPCSNIVNLSQSSLREVDNHIGFSFFVFWTFSSEKDLSLRDLAVIAGDSSKLIGDLSLKLFLPRACSSKNISFANSNISFRSD